MALILLPLDLSTWPAPRRGARSAGRDSPARAPAAAKRAGPRATPQRASTLQRIQARALRAKEML